MRVLQNRSGFTLVELIVVMVLAGILFGIATLNFINFNRKAEIEKITRELVTDLNFARSDSIFRGKRHAVIINPTATGYSFRRYSSVDEPQFSTAPNPPTATTPPYGIISTKSFKYGLAKEGGGSAAGIYFIFDRNGYLETVGDTIRVNPVNSGASFDCVVLSKSRTNIGNMEGGSCVRK